MTGVLWLDLDLDMDIGFRNTLIQILDYYLDFEGAKNIHVLSVLTWDFGGHWRFLTRAWYLYLDLHMVTIL